MKNPLLELEKNKLNYFTNSIVNTIDYKGYCRCRLVNGDIVDVVKGYTIENFKYLSEKTTFTHFETKLYKNCLELNSKQNHQWLLNGKHYKNNNFDIVECNIPLKDDDIKNRQKIINSNLIRWLKSQNYNFDLKGNNNSVIVLDNNTIKKLNEFEL